MPLRPATVETPRASPTPCGHAGHLLSIAVATPFTTQSPQLLGASRPPRIAQWFQPSREPAPLYRSVTQTRASAVVALSRRGHSVSDITCVEIFVRNQFVQHSPKESA